MTGLPDWHITLSRDDAAISPVTILRAGLAALDAEAYELVAARFEREVRGRLAQDAKAWQILGLAGRGLQDSERALTAFAQSAQLAPDDPLIAHGRARVALEAGKPAVSLFNRAHTLARQDGSVVLGRAAAQIAQGEGEAALNDLARVLDLTPGWFEGHVAYARLAAAVGGDTDRGASLKAAIAKFPRVPELRLALVQIGLQAADYAGAREDVRAARAIFGEAPELTRLEAVCLSESGEPVEAQALFDKVGVAPQGEAILPVLRNLIRLGRYDEALERAGSPRDPRLDPALWPYRALLWRLADDPRWRWLEGDPRLVGEYDLAATLGPLDELANLLRSLHVLPGQPLDQSVRRGSQTDGNLLARADPELRRLRAAVLDAVSTHVAQLPAPDPKHPTLPARRAPIRIAGSWSVRLTGAGRHIDHAHPQGWLSSAFYVALPGGEAGIGRGPARHDGWLSLGECRELVPDLAPIRLVEPQPGKLVLFPSTMWHGTRPFAQGERLTVALDIARPLVGGSG